MDGEEDESRVALVSRPLIAIHRKRRVNPIQNKVKGQEQAALCCSGPMLSKPSFFTLLEDHLISVLSHDVATSWHKPLLDIFPDCFKPV